MYRFIDSEVTQPLYLPNALKFLITFNDDYRMNCVMI